jgi:ABC-2 type transport system ATP-binding protein
LGQASTAATTTGRPASRDIVLRTFGLSKRYGRRLALDRLDLEVPRGRVFGFLGPNGAGKTTAISLLLGLLHPTEGHAELFGLDSRMYLPDALRRVGAVVEGQAYYPLLSARENLTVWAALYGESAERRIDEVLDLVGLTSRARDRVRTYSQGMKQRLGLAAALLHDPELLVLDEPTNGLDPAGMREFRDLIQELGRSGKTVFVSSHLLGEVEQMCDDVAIVKSGRLLTQGPVVELLRQGEALELQTTDTGAAVAVLQGIDWVRSVARDGDRLTVEAPLERAAELSRALAEGQIYLSELRPREGSLEDFFLEVTGEDDERSDG